MPRTVTNTKPSSKAIKSYYSALQELHQQEIFHEGAVRSAFQNLLSDVARKNKWILIPELSETATSRRVVPDGTIRDQFHMPRGYWEAKDSADDLDIEIQKKLNKGYPTTNIIFEDTNTGVLYQSGREILRADLTNSGQLTELLNKFFAYEQPDIKEFEKAVVEFSGHVKDLATGLKEKIELAHKNNDKFKTVYKGFFELCRKSLNPNIRKEAVDEMLIQHLLTERLFRTIFDNPEFTSRNVIAVEVEKVIGALVSKDFSRKGFLTSLDRFYVAIEKAARNLTDFSEKQHFLNSIYEQFFRGYSVKVADTHGIVYTPQPVVEFMCNSVAEVLKSEFGKSLSDPDVYILDPCTGTGNFIVNLMKMIPKRDLPRMYRDQLFANEVMLMPYYIAAMNIEHAYYEKTGEYESFDGICFVDTLDLAETQTEIFYISAENAERVHRQKNAPITVIIGNPPYNVGQLNENDNNKNRVYPTIDGMIKETYAKSSKATNKNALYDAYVKFICWATDRIGSRDGIICFVTNNSFVDNIAFDGMRYHLSDKFYRIYHVDLHGNVRKNPKLSGTTHNIFGIQVGVGITILIRKSESDEKEIYYNRVPEEIRKEEKNKILRDAGDFRKIKWQKLTPDEKNVWLKSMGADSFGLLLPIAYKSNKETKPNNTKAIFQLSSSGIKTNRDTIVYDYHQRALSLRIKNFIENYNSEVDRYLRSKKTKVDTFVSYDKVKWSESLKNSLARGVHGAYDETKIRHSIYRPFTKKYLFFDSLLNERHYQFHHIFPTSNTEKENFVICMSGIGSSKPFHEIITNIIPCLDLIEKTQCFPLYIYNEDGSNRKDNITDWALKEFKAHYNDKKISKKDIFYHIYGFLHHPEYRRKYADCLRRELPRIPYAPDFWAFSKAGKKLAEIHLNYEKAEPYKLEFIETADIPLSYMVKDKMRLSKDKASLIINPSLTLTGIPIKAFEYRLGNRSALDWVIDQYRIKEDKRSGIISDPNNPDDPEYIVRLVSQVISVSLETVDIVNSLPKDFGD
ncbi:MAG: DNA helicase [candidate division Zixibacteria bacterium HGW-Zixibacteria-1]|nr:MAG: DNA helicase [candidate division Zixibacteria bacterium HGW-Zixibacteria-1]